MLKSNSSAAVGGYTAEEAASDRYGMESPRSLRVAFEAINFGVWGGAPGGNFKASDCPKKPGPIQGRVCAS